MPKATVLMALQGVDIGGVETHVMVLSRHLAEMGYKVVVASAGGVYERELAAMGIRHCKVNLWVKKPRVVIRSLRQIKAILREEQVDLMHAHARIPAFVCNMASRLTGVPYMTTAHTDFVNNPLLQLISSWGQKTISVSEDIERHMTREFKVPASRQTVIFNGIDTERFQAGLEAAGLQSELGLGPDSRNIIYISRLDNEIAGVACQVMDAFEMVAGGYPEAALLLAGGGNREEEVKSRAEAINRRLGGSRVKILGRRTDIPQLLNLGDLFIGVSRSALEAMACELPVILAGSWGYVGPFGPEIQARLQKDNFTGRTFNRPLQAAELAADIRAELARDLEESIEIGKYNRRLVLEQYSSRLMAEQTAQVYEDILKRSVKSWASSTKKGGYSGKSMSWICWLLCWSWLQSAEASISMFL